MLLFLSCGNKELIKSDAINLSHQSYNNVISSIATSSLEAALTVPNVEGAIGRNQEDYFHVRFQTGINTLSDYAIATESMKALEATILTIEYAFQYQQEVGDFAVNVPAELAYFGAPNDADLASGTAFFGSSLGLTLLSLSQSKWFTTSTMTSQRRALLASYDTHFQKMLDYLKRSKTLLFTADQAAPNRLLFNAVAFQALGTYLADQEAIDIAEEFLLDALSYQDDSLGYFIEGGGWDSSYNGVALQLGLELFMILDDSSIRTQLKEALQKSAQWQLSRILTSGEIDQEGNTRVFDGGESFLGTEKEIDYAKRAKSFIYLSILADNIALKEIAYKILSFYT